ncbi:MAG: hypothetical protein OFPI_43190 [Osedax symbiont Rs2]|nr:MAG: hypothetical protein OFPI_43190 [Osedax symbiont Rs2]
MAARIVSKVAASDIKEDCGSSRINTLSVVSAVAKRLIIISTQNIR